MRRGIRNGRRMEGREKRFKEKKRIESKNETIAFVSGEKFKRGERKGRKKRI